MPRGLKKHLKTLAANSLYNVGKTHGTFVIRATEGPHKASESIPIAILLRERLGLALTRQEANHICKQKNVLVDGKVKTNCRYPIGFQDVITLPKCNKQYRILFDTKGRMKILPITEEEATYKICKVRRYELLANGIPAIVTHDGRTIRYPPKEIKKNDSVKINIEQNSVEEVAPIEVGALVMITGGRSRGRVGRIVRFEKHIGSFEIIHIRDADGNTFATRLNNAFVIGSENTSLITLPTDRGVRVHIMDDRENRLARQ
ncbi:hypothetical protein PCE1_001473 [Barthelona sp. PCE]